MQVRHSGRLHRVQVELKLKEEFKEVFTEMFWVELRSGVRK